MPSIRTTVREHIDLAVLLVAFSYLIAVSFDYPERTRQFPLIFLGLGLVLVLVEIMAVLLPEQYSRRFDVLTEGLASDIEDMAEDEGVTEEDHVQEALDETEEPSDTIDKWRTSGAILLFTGVSYVAGVLWGIPIFVFTIFAFTTRDWVRAFIVSAVLMVIAFFIFGNIMNVPVARGLL